MPNIDLYMHLFYLAGTFITKRQFHQFSLISISKMKRMIFLFGALVSLINASSPDPATWSAAEIQRTKSRLWTIFKNPIKFVKWLKTPNPRKDCGSDCWHGCDDFR